MADLTYNETYKYMEMCPSLTLPNFMPDDIIDYLKTISIESGFKYGFLINPLLSTISQLMAQSSILTLRTYTERCTLFTAVVATSASGKSPSTKVIRQAYRKYERFEEIPLTESKIVNPATVEGFLRHIKKLENVLCLYEEALTYLHSAYITNERLIIENPRVNISIFGQPSIFLKLVHDEMRSKDDGLIHRFLLMGVERKSLTAKEIMESPRKLCCLSIIFYFISKLNQEAIQFRLDEQAILRFNDIYDKIGQKIDVANRIDGFISAMLGKTCSLILKLAMIFHMFEYAFYLVKNNEQLNREILNEVHKEWGCEVHANSLFFL
ncbi:unnamed protein product [Brachionus calyciflorus]|uniref:DUF3987 domain-containing protein n=1 Tax=Brachionus calyciflorus TaxID=104777 RepID=A0A814DCT5_9BILA|nr:unnamed protein product [Brachionus calyciflorus]